MMQGRRGNKGRSLEVRFKDYSTAAEEVANTAVGRASPGAVITVKGKREMQQLLANGSSASIRKRGKALKQGSYMVSMVFLED